MTDNRTDWKNDMQRPWYGHFNLPTILAVLGVGWGIASYVKDLSNGLESMQVQVQNQNAMALERAKQTDAKFDQLMILPMQVQNLQISDQAQNQRMDRIADTIIEALRKDINAVSVKVEVLTTKIDNMNGQRKSELSYPQHQ
jgi:hypothetical protein